jgi:hypothetical protein
MSGGRAREASRAVAACLQGAVPVLGRVAGDPREEAVAVVVRVVEEAMVAAEARAVVARVAVEAAAVKA